MAILLERDVIIKIDVCTSAIFIVDLTTIPLALNRNSIRCRLRRVESAAQTSNAAVVARRATINNVVNTRIVERGRRPESEDLMRSSDSKFNTTRDTETVLCNGDVGPDECKRRNVALC